MLSLGELAEEARDRAIDKAEAVTDAKAQIIARLLVKDIIAKTGGWWLYDEHTFTTTASTASYAFPSRLMKPLILFNTTNNKEVEPTHWRVERGDIDRGDSGTPECYAMTYLRDVQNQPSSASTISVSSSSSSDTSANNHYLRLRGLDSNYIEIRETLSMNGTSTVTSSNTYLEVWTCRKATSESIADDTDNRYFTNGQYTVTSNSAAVTLVKLSVDEPNREFQWFRFYPIPDAADSYRLHFLRKPIEVSSNYDKLDLPDFLEAAAILYLEWYIKWFLLDDRDEKTWNLYVAECVEKSEFLKKIEGERFAHHGIDPTRGGRLYQPPAGYISRRAL